MPVANYQASTKVTFQQLTDRVKQELIKGLKLHTIPLEDLMAILFIFSRATNTEELHFFCSIFNDEFPILKGITEEQESKAQLNMEGRIKTAISKLVQKNPMLAAQIAKAAIKPGISWEDLVTQFPELET